MQQTRPIPEIARLDRTLKQWNEAFLGYFTTGGANNGGTESTNGLIELAVASLEGSATPTTTASGCSSLAAVFAYEPTLRSEEPPEPGFRACTRQLRGFLPSALIAV